MKLLELFNDIKDYDLDTKMSNPNQQVYKFKSGNDTIVVWVKKVSFDSFKDSYEIAFGRLLPGEKYPTGKLTNSKDSISVFSTVFEIAKEFVKKNNVDLLFVSCEKQRESAYKSMLTKLASKIGYKMLEPKDYTEKMQYLQDNSNSLRFYLIKR